MTALVDVGVPTPEPYYRDADTGITADQLRELDRLTGKSGGWRRAVVGNLSLLAQRADQLCARRPALAIRSGEVVIAGIEPIEGAGDFRLVEWQWPGAVRAERQRRDRRLAR